MSSDPDAPPILETRASPAQQRPIPAPRSGMTARAGLCARLVLAGVLLYAAIDTALLFLRPQFSLLHNAESDYGSRGSWRWLMDLNFLVRCALSLIAVRAVMLAVRRYERSARLRAGLALVSVWAIASGLLAFFPDDPVGTPTRTAGQIHLALAFVAFIAIVFATVLATRALRAMARWQPVSAAMTLLSWGAIVPLLLLGHTHFGVHSLGGLYEKTFLAMQLAWIAITVAPLAINPRSSRRRS